MRIARLQFHAFNARHSNCYSTKASTDSRWSSKSDLEQSIGQDDQAKALKVIKSDAESFA
jgi:hypothetical protein